MADYDCVLCLFCKAGKEQGVVEHICARGWGHAIFARKTKRMLNHQTKRWEEFDAPLLPGYVFVYLQEKDPVLRGRLLGTQNVLRILSYGDGRQDYLTGRDLEFAAWVWQMDGKIGKLQVAQVGDRIEICDSAFRSLRGVIRRVDRRRQTCQVELDAQGIIRDIWLPYDMVQRVGEDGGTPPAGA